MNIPTSIDPLSAERIQAAIDALKAQGKDPTLELNTAMQEAQQKAFRVWRDGSPPMSLGPFAYRVAGFNLSARQEAAFRGAGLWYPQDVISPDRRVQEVVLAFGKGSGKDRIASIFIAYMAYLVLHLAGDPAIYYGLAPKTPLHILNVAPSEDLARRVFFAYLKQDIGSDLFAPFITNPKMQILSDEIRFPDVGLYLYSAHSNSKGMDGYNLLAWIMDEADDFLDNEKRSNADIVHNILRSSANTRLRNRWVGMVISYMRYAEGFVDRVYRRGKGDPTFFVDKAATWEVREDVSRDDPGIASDYANDPADAAARYECRPLQIADAFFEMPEKIDAAVDNERFPCIDVVTNEIIRSERPDGSVIETIGGGLLSSHPKPGATYFLAGDGGLSGDSFAIALFRVDAQERGAEWLCPDCTRFGTDQEVLGVAHYEIMPPYSRAEEDAYCGVCGMAITEREYGTLRCDGWAHKVMGERKSVLVNGRPVTLPQVIEEGLLEFRPERASRVGQVNRPVNFASVQNVCRDIIQSCAVVQARFDPWNTAQMVQGLQGVCDVDVIQFSQPEQYRRARVVKAMLYAGLISLLPNEKRDKEWKRLQRNKERIDHPEGGSKDLYDAESVAIWLAARWACGALEVV
jgi:hypothetical protein